MGHPDAELLGIINYHVKYRIGLANGGDASWSFDQSDQNYTIGLPSAPINSKSFADGGM
jgi:hypothetical protein